MNYKPLHAAANTVQHSTLLLQGINMFISNLVNLVSRDKSIQTLRIHQFVGITTKMGKNFAFYEAVVGKIKRNLICSRSVVHVVGACHKCRIH